MTHRVITRQIPMSLPEVQRQQRYLRRLQPSSLRIQKEAVGHPETRLSLQVTQAPVRPFPGLQDDLEPQQILQQRLSRITARGIASARHLQMKPHGKRPSIAGAKAWRVRTARARL